MNIEHHQELTLLYPAMRVKGAFSPFRRKKVLHRHVRTIFDSTGSDPRLREEKGEGHEFRPYTNPQFCDLCGEFIWGVYKQSLRCRICKFTCHHRCRELIRLDCQRQRSQLGSTSEQELDEDGKVEQVQSQVLSREEIEQKIKLYNVRSSSKTSMVQQENGTFTGFIKVQLNLQRPVSVADDGRAHNALLQPVAAPGPAGGGWRQRHVREHGATHDLLPATRHREAGALEQHQHGARGDRGAAPQVPGDGQPTQVRPVPALGARRAGVQAQAERRGKPPAPAPAERTRPDGNALRHAGERDRRGHLGSLHRPRAAEFPADFETGRGCVRAQGPGKVRRLSPEAGGGSGHTQARL
ncbi:unnamed protein product, partial [Lampetra planeri]